MWVIARDPVQAIPLKLKNKRTRRMYEQGVCALYNVQCGQKHAIFACIYGETGGAENASAAQRTDDIIDAVREELKEHKDSPQCILGDFNAGLEDIPTLVELVEQEGWVDCGARADIWGGQNNQTTCKAPNANRETRRDYVIAGPEFARLIKSIRVEKENEVYPNHWPIVVEFQTDKIATDKKIYRKTTSAAQRLEPVSYTHLTLPTNREV